MMAGQAPDPRFGQVAKQRSVHNNYFTLPVLFIMISNHASMTYSHPYSWLILAAIIAAGVLIRHFFNLKHKGRMAWQYPIAGVILLLIVAIAIAPRPAPSQSAQVDFARVQSIITQRCVSCHAEHPTQEGFASAPLGFKLDSAALIEQHAAKIFQQSVQSKNMPLANLTQMTDEERAVPRCMDSRVN